MWIAVRPFTYRGKRYEAGEQVPAEGWNIRRGLMARGKIRKGTPDPATMTVPKLKAMTRAELNHFAAEIGIEDPTSYPNREALIAAINGEEAVDEDQSDGTNSVETDDSEEASESDDSGDEDLEDSDSEETEDDEDQD